nr:MAG TPA: hypothetical protein [Caudoviricetes sp.]
MGVVSGFLFFEVFKGLSSRPVVFLSDPLPILFLQTWKSKIFSVSLCCHCVKIKLF